MPKMDEEMLKAIRRKRGELNLTTKELANQTGVGQVTLSKIMRGERQNTQDNTIEKLNHWLYQFI